MTCNRKQGASAAQSHKQQRTSGAIAFSREVGRPGGQPRGGIALGHPPSPIPGFDYGGRPDRRRGEYIASAVVVSLCAKEQRRRKSGIRASGANRHVVLSFFPEEVGPTCLVRCIRTVVITRPIRRTIVCTSIIALSHKKNLVMLCQTTTKHSILPSKHNTTFVPHPFFDSN